MLYMGDRKTLPETGCTITGDHPVAMRNGPVLSRSYDLIKGKDASLQLWAKYIQNEGPQDVRLIRDPGVGHL